MAKKGSITVTPWCPFCGQDVAKPKEPENRKMVEFLLGRCQCGAVYACDQTGHNVGAAMVDCLVHACNDNWDMAWELMPDDDYLTSRIENYDLNTHQVVDTRNLDGRAVGGVLYFVRIHSDISEITEVLKKNKGETKTIKQTVAIEPLRDPKRKKRKAGKAEVKQLADKQDIEGLVDLVFDDQRVLRYLQRLLYDPDPDKMWLYAYVIGQVCARFSTRKPGAVSDLLHRLFESCSDSASTHWGLIEAIGSIISARPDIYGAFTSHLLMHRNVDSVRANVVWAMAAIAEVQPQIVRSTPIYSLFPFIDHSDPLTRGLATLLFGRIKATELKNKIQSLLEDPASIRYYEKGRPVTRTIGDIAQEALAKIEEK